MALTSSYSQLQKARFLKDLCRRIVSNDATVTQLIAIHLPYDAINALIEALQLQQQQWNGNSSNNNRSNNPIQIQTLTLTYECKISVESLMQLLSLLCHRTAINNPCTTAVPMPSSEQQHLPPSSSSSLKSLKLYISASQIGDQTSIDIVQRLFHGMAMDQPPGLGLVEEVSLNRMRVNWNESMAQALRDALMSPNCQLVKLQLAESQLTDDVMQWLALGFPTSQSNSNNTLTELDLSQNEIGDVGAQQLARMLPFFSSLCVLQLKKNRIGDDGAVALAAALSQQHPNNHHPTRCSALTSLMLESNQIGDVGVVALIQAIRSHPTLTHWTIHNNPKIQLKGHQALIDSIPHLGKVQTLELGPFGNYNTKPITTTEAQLMRKLAAGMEQNHVLQDVYLCVKKSDYPMWHNTQLQYIVASHRNALREHTSVIPPHLSEDKQHQLTILPPLLRSNGFDMIESLQVISFFSNLNRSKLRPVLLSPSPHQHHESTQPPQIGLPLWPQILTRLQHVPSLVFYMLREKPTLTLYRNGSSSMDSSKKRACQELVSATTSKRLFVMQLPDES